MPTALLVIDVLNPYDHEDAEPLAAAAEPVTPVIAELRDRAREAGVLVVQTNDHHGRWHTSPEDLYAAALAGRRPDLVEPLRPHPGDPFLVKARHSAFYDTMLPHLLALHEIDRVVLTGQVTEQCVLATAQDAYVRTIDVCVPCDAVAGIHADLHEPALAILERTMHAETRPASEVRF